MRKATKIGKLHRLTLFQWQTVQGFANRGALQRKRNLAPRIGGRSGGPHLRLELPLLALVSATPAHSVNRSVANGRDKPCAQ